MSSRGSQVVRKALTCLGARDPVRVSARAAGLLGQWPDALRFIQAEANAMRERDAPLPEVAFAEFNSYSALVGRAG